MNLTLLKEFFADFLRTRHIARHFRRLAMLETVTDASVSREVPPSLAQTLVASANRSTVQLLGVLGSHAEGLSTQEADALRVQYGLNEVEHEQPLPWWVHLWHCYKNPFNLLLTLLAVISWLTEDMKAATVIFSMVVLSTLL
ncbi:cation-transporting P-type ATPase, partial [Pseudomonas fluorescens]